MKKNTLVAKKYHSYSNSESLHMMSSHTPTPVSSLGVVSPMSASTNKGKKRMESLNLLKDNFNANRWSDFDDFQELQKVNTEDER